VLSDAIEQAWPPFVLVAGLLLIGVVAHGDGLFAQAGGVLDRVPGSPLTLFAAAAALVALVTAVLNLDTAVVFLTPVLVLAARRRGLHEEPFVYAAVFMANASSLYLPGSNLTNLLVLAGQPISGARFAAQFFAPALAATLVTGVGLAVIFRARLVAGTPQHAATDHGSWLGPGAAGATAAAALTVALREPALPVLGVGLATAATAVFRGRIMTKQIAAAVSPIVLSGLFAFAVTLGVLARSWHGPAHLVAHAGRPVTAALGAASAVLTNNLPAAVMLSAGDVPHPRALLIGLNLGPNLAVTGSLASYLWIKAARQVGASTSVRAFSRRGFILAPAAMLAALLVGTR
jgi:arsenical pump membrane protein